MTVVAIPLRETLLEGGDRLLAGLLGAVGFLVLLVAANLAGLLLVRLEERGQEFALRAALGAGGSRLLVPFVLEAAAIVAVGGGLGFAAAAAAGRWLAPLVPGAMADLLASTAVDGRVALFTLAVATLVVLCVAVPAALGASRRDPASALRGGARSGGRPGRWRAQRLLAAGEVSLALGLAIGAGGLLRDVARRLDAGAGYAHPEAVQTFSISLSGPNYDQGSERSAAVDALVERIAALPEVAAAGATTTFPSSGGNQLSQFELEHVGDADGERRLANYRSVTPSFFDALGLSVLRGRLLTAADRADAPPVVVVNASLARRAFGAADPIGRRLRDRRDPGGRWLEIVGVVPDVREFYDVDDTYYAPYVQQAGARAATEVTVALRGGSDRGAGLPTLAALRAAVATADPDFAVADLATAAQLLDESVAGARAASRFAGFFAFFGLALAAVGLYGTVARAVAGRRREIGLRRALGASSLAVVGLFFRQGIATAVAGIVAGSALGWLGGRWLLARAGTGEGALEAGAMALAATVVVVAVVAATLWPAWRALRVDPGSALRAE
jgi:predicted permease